MFLRKIQEKLEGEAMRDFMKAIATISVFAAGIFWMYVAAFIVMGGLGK